MRSKWIDGPQWWVWLLLAGFFWFVWPTPWRYGHYGEVPMRISRLTGEVQLISCNGQWEPVGAMTHP